MKNLVDSFVFGDGTVFVMHHIATGIKLFKVKRETSISDFTHFHSHFLLIANFDTLSLNGDY